VNGTKSTGAFSTFLFNSTTHILSWDADGTGSEGAIDIVRLDGMAALHAANFELQWPSEPAWANGPSYPWAGVRVA
jgi:hypothetical protein